MPPPETDAPAVEQFPARTAAIWAALQPRLAGAPLQVLDVGGGSGMFAVPLAELGHQVTVVDTSADALATLARRAGTAGVGAQVRALQGDADRLRHALARDDVPDAFDLVLCHYVLEVVDDPQSTLREVATVLRPGAPVSIAVANRAGAVLARALGGHPVEARTLLADGTAVPGRGSSARRRFSPDELLGLARTAGLEPGVWHGVSVVADLLGAASGADPEAVRTLELALAGQSPYRDVATAVHVLAVRPAGPTITAASGVSGGPGSTGTTAPVR